MPSPDVVRSTAVARREVRNSLDRLAYHLTRGPKGTRGVNREVAFLNALGRQLVRVNGGALGIAYTGAGAGSFGQKALQALQTGNAATIGRLKSSLLADFSANGLQPIRDQATRMDGGWYWVANASACPSCLAFHGSAYPAGKPFTQLHPSCLCIPMPLDTPGIRELTDEELLETWSKYGDSRYSGAMREFEAGAMPRSALRRVEGVNLTPKGAQAVAQHLLKGEARQVALGGSSTSTASASSAPAPPAPAPSGREALKAQEERLLAEKARLQKELDDLTMPADAKPWLHVPGTEAHTTARRLADEFRDAQAALRQRLYAVQDDLRRVQATLAEAENSVRSLAWGDRLQSVTKGVSTKWQGTIVDDAFSILDERVASLGDEMAARVRAKFNAAIDNIGTFRVQAGSMTDAEAAKGIRVLGHWAERTPIKGRGVVERELMVELRRTDMDAFNAWVAARERAVTEAWETLPPSEQSRAMAAWRAANPPPAMVRRATAEEVADTLGHELTHVLDSVAAGRPLRKSIQANGIFDDVYQTYERDHSLWYAASKNDLGQPMMGETAAELARFYLFGTEGVSAAAWRAKYPAWAEWVEKVVFPPLVA